MKYSDLCDQLDRAADRLTERVLSDMYEDPFWLERFGERAQRHGRQDGRYHIDYLRQALGSDDVAVFESYARWLQQVLTTRGMCTRHLAENFDRLGHAIAAESWPDRDAACTVLAAGTRALSYPAGTARHVQDHASVLVEATIAVLHARHPDWSRARCAANLEHHVSYAADALALGSPATFLAHITWFTGFLARHGVPRTEVLESLEVLREAPDAHPDLRGLLTEALHALAS